MGWSGNIEIQYADATITFCFWTQIRNLGTLPDVPGPGIPFWASRAASPPSVAGTEKRVPLFVGGTPSVSRGARQRTVQNTEYQLRPGNAFRIQTWGRQFATSLPDIRPIPAPVMWPAGYPAATVIQCTAALWTTRRSPQHALSCAKCAMSRLGRIAASSNHGPIRAVHRAAATRGNRCAFSAALAGAQVGGCGGRGGEEARRLV